MPLDSARLWLDSTRSRSKASTRACLPRCTACSLAAASSRSNTSTRTRFPRWIACSLAAARSRSKASARARLPRWTACILAAASSRSKASTRACLPRWTACSLAAARSRIAVMVPSKVTSSSSDCGLSCSSPMSGSRSSLWLRSGSVEILRRDSHEEEPPPPLRGLLSDLCRMCPGVPGGGESGDTPVGESADSPLSPRGRSTIGELPFLASEKEGIRKLQRSGDRPLSRLLSSVANPVAPKSLPCCTTKYETAHSLSRASGDKPLSRGAASSGDGRPISPPEDIRRGRERMGLSTAGGRASGDKSFARGSVGGRPISPPEDIRRGRERIGLSTAGGRASGDKSFARGSGGGRPISAPEDIRRGRERIGLSTAGGRASGDKPLSRGAASRGCGRPTSPPEDTRRGRERMGLSTAAGEPASRETTGGRAMS
eukprot:3111072-Prymnesium_polylepis.1